MASSPIYLDYNATTPIDPAVLAAMLPYLKEHYGNPSSTHAFGNVARQAVEHAREQVASLLNGQPAEIVFTGGGSEASNLAIKGVLWAAPLCNRIGEPPQIITSAIEHPATWQPCQFLTRLGCRVEILSVNRHGLVSLDELEKALHRPTALVSIMHSNNEVGTLQPIAEISRMAHAAGALVHCDAAQSLGKVPVDVQALGVDLLTLAGHKFYAPKGIGALFVRHATALEPLIHGAGHELGRRAGTENVPYIVGLGEAARLAQSSLPAETNRLMRLRDRLWHALQQRLGDRVQLNGDPDLRLPNTLNVNFAGWVGSDLLDRTPGVAASTGSACHEGRLASSPVLQAMGVPEELARGAVRLTVGRFTKEEDVDHAADLLIQTASTKSQF